MGLTEDQIKHLGEKLDPKNVKERKQGGATLSYVEGWHVIAEANRIFGFDGWTRETIELTENCAPTKNKNNNAVVSFRAKVRITACGIVREGVGFGSGISYDVHDAYEGAIKEAETDAMKRALMTFGNPFGLALYDKAKTNVGASKSENQIWLESIRDRINACQNFDELKAIKGEQETKDMMQKLSPKQVDWFNEQFNTRAGQLSQTQVQQQKEGATT